MENTVSSVRVAEMEGIDGLWLIFWREILINPLYIFLFVSSPKITPKIPKKSEKEPVVGRTNHAGQRSWRNCYCGRLVNIWTSWMSENPGRRFHACASYGGGAGGPVVASWKKGSALFRHSSPLWRENSIKDSWTGGGSVGDGGASGPVAMNLTDKQYLNIMQSMGQAVYVLYHNKL